MEKGDKVKITIEDISAEGKGIGKADGLAVFAGDTVPGDVVEVQLTKLKKNYALGTVTGYVKYSPDRIPARCPWAGQCGGCTYQNLDYKSQLEVKTKQVREKLRRLGGIADPEVNPSVGMENPFNYRNKAVMPVSTGGLITKKGGVTVPVHEPRIGFYRAKSHDVTDCGDCMLQAPPAMATARVLRKFMKEDNITSYDERWDKGLMRHLAVRTAFGTGEVMVILVINGKGIPGASKLISMLDDEIARLPEGPGGVTYSLESVVLNIKKGKSSGDVFGGEWKVLAGKPVINEHIGNLDFEISPASFYQVNPVQMVRLYEKALQYADLQGDETVLDLYCGVGSIGLFCADDMRQKGGNGRVIGIESVREAVIDANRNAVINGIVNAVYICGRAEEELQKLMKKDMADGKPALRADVAVIDPPRAGCRPELLKSVADLGVDRIIYVSCDPATMARDIRELDAAGYELQEVTPVDMFPWTGRTEAVGLLKLR